MGYANVPKGTIRGPIGTFPSLRALLYRITFSKITPMKRRLSSALFLIGFVAIVGQILLIRELLVIFYGNELSTAIILGSWLIWTSLGSATLGRIADAISHKHRVFGLAQLVLAFLLPSSILAVRLSKILWNIPVGEIVDLATMMGISFTILAPLCFLSGFLFLSHFLPSSIFVTLLSDLLFSICDLEFANCKSNVFPNRKL